MRRLLPLLLMAGAGGCSLSGQTLGLTNNRHPLLEEVELQREVGATLPRELSKTLLERYTLEPGDGLLLLPADLDSPVRLPTDQTILADGSIDLGRYGRLVVAGKTLEQVELLIKEAVGQITPDAGFIDVRLVNRQSKVYYVLGEVQTPGKFPLIGNETTLDAILQAGGLTDKGSRSRIILVRSADTGCGVVYGVNYSRIVQLGEVATNYQIQPGDRIFVPTQTFWEQIHGEAKK